MRWERALEFYAEFDEQSQEEVEKNPAFKMHFLVAKLIACDNKQYKLRQACQTVNRRPGVAMMAQVPARHQPQPQPRPETRPCFDFQGGHCDRGSACRFSHETSSRGGFRGGRGGRGGGRGAGRGGHGGGGRQAFQVRQQAFTGTCHNCGKTGHKQQQCRQPPASANLATAARPSNVYANLGGGGFLSYLADVEGSSDCINHCKCVWDNVERGDDDDEVMSNNVNTTPNTQTKQTQEVPASRQDVVELAILLAASLSPQELSVLRSL